MIGTGLQEIESAYDKEQDTTIFNWGSDWQAQRHQVLLQIGSYLEI